VTIEVGLTNDSGAGEVLDPGSVIFDDPPASNIVLDLPGGANNPVAEWLVDMGDVSMYGDMVGVLSKGVASGDGWCIAGDAKVQALGQAEIVGDATVQAVGQAEIVGDATVQALGQAEIVGDAKVQALGQAEIVGSCFS